jgi:hypothetical protein
MHVKAGVAVEPAGDRGMLMGGVIVGDDVDVELGRGLLIDGFEALPRCRSWGAGRARR